MTITRQIIYRFWSKLAVILTIVLLQQATILAEEQDSDGDGMPDEWEIKWGFLDPNDPRDAELDNNLNGTSNLDEYKFRDYPGPDYVGHKKRGLMKPLSKWTDDEIISLLDDVSAAGYFFRIIRNAYGRHRGYYEDNAIKKLKEVYPEGLKALENGEPVPKGFYAAVRWFHELDPSSYPVVHLRLYDDKKLYHTVAIALCRNSREYFDPLTSDEINQIIEQFGDLNEDRKEWTVNLLIANDCPVVRQFLLSPDFPSSFSSPKVRARVQRSLASLAKKTTYDRRPYRTGPAPEEWKEAVKEGKEVDVHEEPAIAVPKPESEPVQVVAAEKAEPPSLPEPKQPVKQAKPEKPSAQEEPTPSVQQTNMLAIVVAVIVVALAAFSLTWFIWKKR